MTKKEQEELNLVFEESENPENLISNKEMRKKTQKMALEIYWTKRANKKFDQIIDYLQKEWGENVAKAFVRKVYEFLDILS